MQRYMHKARTLVVGCFAALTSVLMMSGTALAAAPPSCVDASIVDGGEYGTVRVVNNCATTQRVKVLIAFGPDSQCFIIGPADSRSHVIDDHIGPGHPRFDGLQSC